MKKHSDRNILFIHDGPVYKDEDGAVYGIHYNNKLVERYRYLGGKVRFLMREILLPRESLENRFSKIDAPDFSFIPIPDFKGIISYFTKRHRAKNIIHQAIDDADIAVIRMPSAAGGIAINYCDKVNKPFLVEMVACTLDAYWNYSWKGKLIAHWRYHLVRRIMRKVKYAIYVSEFFLQERYPISGKVDQLFGC
jgi:hypothetical protein